MLVLVLVQVLVLVFLLVLVLVLVTMLVQVVCLFSQPLGVSVGVDVGFSVRDGVVAGVGAGITKWLQISVYGYAMFILARILTLNFVSNFRIANIKFVKGLSRIHLDFVIQSSYLQSIAVHTMLPGHPTRGPWAWGYNAYPHTRYQVCEGVQPKSIRFWYAKLRFNPHTSAYHIYTRTFDQRPWGIMHTNIP